MTGQRTELERNRAREIIKGRLQDYLEHKGIDTRKNFNCLNPQHADSDPSMTFYSDTNKAYCHGCGASYDTLDIIGIDNNTDDYNEQLKAGCRIYGLTYPSSTNTPPAPKPIKEKVSAERQPNPEEPAEDLTAYFEECNARMSDPAAISYLQARGINPRTAAAYGIGYDPEADPAKSGHKAPRIIIPTSTSHYVARDIRSDLTEAQRPFAKMNNRGGTPDIFNKRILRTSVKEIFVTEGAFDALSIIEAGGLAIALNSTSNGSKLIKILEETPPEALFIICPDNDANEAGQKAAAELAEALTAINVRHVIADINLGYKDANEALQNERSNFISTVNRVQVNATRPDNAASYITLGMNSDIERFKSVVNTGFDGIDEETGGLYAGLYTLAATSSLGKTTLIHQIADNIADQGHDVIFFSLEQSRLELVSKSIARTMFKNDKRTAANSLQLRRGYSSFEVTLAKEEYQAGAGQRLSIVEGNFNCTPKYIRNYVESHTRRTNARPVVIVDYLQIMQPDTENKYSGKREDIDNIVTELKRITRDLDITMIIVSSVNRGSYLVPVSFESLKESGGIEYTCDVVLGLQLQCLRDSIFNKQHKLIEKRKAISRASKLKDSSGRPLRLIELTCLKNRYGRKDWATFFEYYPANDTFVETGELDARYAIYEEDDYYEDYEQPTAARTI